ncbi:MAG: FtsX-like permease family protein, partial [Terriglobales bacterium]
AMGAGRWRLARQMLTESVLLALLGAAGGILLAFWGIDIIRGMGPGNFPRLDKVELNSTVLWFTLGVSLLTALVFGLSPSLLLSKKGKYETLKEGGWTGASHVSRRVRHGLVVAQVALALVLLAGAGLLIRSFISLLNVDLGFQPDRVLAMQVFVYGSKYPTNNERLEFLQQTVERLSALPGVEAAGAASFLPFVEAQIDIQSPYIIASQAVLREGELPTANVTIVTPDYFRVMQIPLLRGRLLQPTDTADGEAVVVINKEMARRHWSTGDPIGEEITPRFGGGKTRRIVGVVGSVRHAGLQGAPVPEVFLPMRQNPFGSMTLLVRAAENPEGLLPVVKAQVWAVDKDMAIWSVASMDQLISDSVAGRRFKLLLFGFFAALALVLAAVGIYGVMAYLVTQRTHEIGIRMALGAQTGDILRLVLGQGLALTLIGVGAGLGGAFALTRVLTSLLYGVTPTDPVTFVAVSLLLAVVAGLACWIPARRATRVDPMVALRYE